MDTSKGKDKQKALFLAISASDEQLAKNQILTHLDKALTYLLDQKPDNTILQELTYNYQKDYKFPQSFHITTLFVGGTKKSKETEYFQKFNAGEEYEIKIYAYAIYPGNIITGICCQDDYSVPILNKYPHVTIMCGNWQPKKSNDLLQLIFDDDTNLYSQVLQSNEDKFFEISFEDKEIYVVRLKNILILKGITKVY